MSALASLPNLRILDLAHNQLGAAGSKALSEVLISICCIHFINNNLLCNMYFQGPR
jgi:Ran GTPase-activating protein (RanGAP) involved in mRNA processing and transport